MQRGAEDTLPQKRDPEFDYKLYPVLRTQLWNSVECGVIPLAITPRSTPNRNGSIC